MRTQTRPRGYVLMVVVVMGVILASLAAVLLYATARDRTEGKLQTSSVRASYAAEAAVAVGIETLRRELEENVAPNLAAVEAQTASTVVTAMPGATFPTLSIRYYDAVTNTTSVTPYGSSALSTIASGPNVGLRAQQTPIQVFAVAQVDKALASVADAVRVDLIPVFQFGVFFDGDLETWIPATMSLNGRVHANGDIYLSNGGDVVTFSQNLTSASLLRSRSAFSSSIAVVADKTLAKNASNVLVSFPTGLPKADDASQKAAIVAAFGTGSVVGDRSTGIQPLSVPIRLSSAVTCDTTCAGGKACVKVRAGDAKGVCMDKIVSRPDKCSDKITNAEFAQSLAIELIRRPAPAYADAGVALDQPYGLGVGALTDIYTSDFGPRPAIVNPRDAGDIFEIQVGKSVPIVRTVEADDDKGSVQDRMYWKAHIRIIDGVWYKRGSSVPVFDPELVTYKGASVSASDLNHKFARVQRYSWWWDARESRVYCVNATDKNCVTSDKYHRGLQIRSSDFDMAAFMNLLEDSAARARFFDGGTTPAAGIIVYVSETYDPKYEDTNTKLNRTANVRNFLDFPIVHNHLTTAEIAAVAAPMPTRLDVAKTVNGMPAVNPPTAHALGWFPENIWGRLAPAGHRSLTNVISSTGVQTTTPAEFPAAYATPGSTGTLGAFECQRGSALTAARLPAVRPSSLATPTILPPCIQAGATPLGAENAVRLVRAQTVPPGFTFVTDNRLYIHGDVNVRNDSSNATTKQDIPGEVAIIADSITIQSERFDDRLRQGGRFESFARPPTGTNSTNGTFTSLATKVLPYVTSPAAGTMGDAPDLCSAIGNTTAIDTRINSSLLMGDVPSCINAGDSNGNRSGGLNNFPRFVEAWNGIRSIINGSIVGLFRSERGNARFTNVGFSGALPGRGPDPYGSDPGCNYTAPRRTWDFDDALLTSIENLPPGTPRVVATDRLRWVRR